MPESGMERIVGIKGTSISRRPLLVVMPWFTQYMTSLFKRSFIHILILICASLLISRFRQARKSRFLIRSQRRAVNYGSHFR